MTLLHIAVAAFAGGSASSLTDWFFLGSDWLYRRFDRHPAIWRAAPSRAGEERSPEAKASEARALAWAGALPFLTAAVFVVTCAWLHLHDLPSTIVLASLIWLLAPLPLTIVNALFLKMSPMIAAFHALGWLVKLDLCAITVSLIVP
jgi:hypothetical protein